MIVYKLYTHDISFLLTLCIKQGEKVYRSQEDRIRDVHCTMCRPTIYVHMTVYTFIFSFLMLKDKFSNSSSTSCASIFLFTKLLKLFATDKLSTRLFQQNFRLFKLFIRLLLAQFDFCINLCIHPL